MKKTACLAGGFLLATALCAQTTNTVPVFVGFEPAEGYTNGMPLINGTNGWYSSSASVKVQDGTVKTGVQAVEIPGGSPGGGTLSGAFEAPVLSNVWIQLDVTPIFYESDITHPVETNSAVMFYVNTNGYFVVHHGSPVPATNWQVITTDASGAPAVPVTQGQWTRIHIYVDFNAGTWDLYADYVKLRSRIDFIDYNMNRLAGLAIFNGSGPTTYVDNVSMRFERPGHTITTDPGVLTNAVFRGRAAPQQTFTIYSATDGNMPLACNILPQTNWMSCTPASCVLNDATPVAVTNTYTTFALDAGAYTSGVLLACSGGWGVTQLMPVVMHVMDIAASPAEMNVSTFAGLDAAPQSLNIWNAGGGRMSYNVEIVDSTPWLEISPTNGVSTGPGDVVAHTVTFHTATLSPQQQYYSAIIRIYSEDAGGASAVVYVNLQIKDKPKLACSPVVLTNTLVHGNSGTCSFEVWKQSGEGTLTYSIVSDASWASPSPSYGKSTGERDPITVTISGTLLEGMYSGVLHIYGTEETTGVDAYNSPQEVEVRVTVTPGPTLNVSPSTLITNRVMQGFDAANQFLTVWNSGGGRLSVHITDDVPWLVPTITNTSWMGRPGERMNILLRYSTVNLSPGVHAGTIIITGGDAEYGGAAGNSPIAVPVELTVVPLPAIECDTSELSASARQGQPTPSHVVKVRNVGDIPRGTMLYSVSTSNAWLTVSPASGSSTGEWSQIAVGYDISTLTPGAWTGKLVIRATDAITGSEAIDSPVEINVTLNMLSANQSDFTGNGKSDLVLYHEPSGQWYIRTIEGELLAWGYKFGGPGFLPFLGDYDGDGTAELCIYGSGKWHVAKLNESKLLASAAWGGAGMTAVPGDYDGDGRQDFGVYSPGSGAWYVYSTDGRILCWGLAWGGSGMSAVPADFNGDGCCDMAVFDPASGNWYIRDLAGNLLAWALAWGGYGFAPMRADFNGDGAADITVYDQATGNWYARSLMGQILLWARSWGGSGFTPVCGDYDGDGRTDIGVYHEATGYWFIISGDGAIIAWALNWGGPYLTPVGLQ